MRKVKVPRTRTRLREQGICEGSGIDVTATRSGTMKCPHCHRTYRITKAGKLWRHTISSPYWGNRAKCHRRHRVNVRCTWCGGVKAK